MPRLLVSLPTRMGTLNSQFYRHKTISRDFEESLVKTDLLLEFFLDSCFHKSAFPSVLYFLQQLYHVSRLNHALEFSHALWSSIFSLSLPKYLLQHDYLAHNEIFGKQRCVRHIRGYLVRPTN